MSILNGLPLSIEDPKSEHYKVWAHRNLFNGNVVRPYQIKYYASEAG
jgi:hypothetical protein